MLDFHTHILQHIDDGAGTLEIAVRMLEEAYEKGTETVILSPHFYPREEVKMNDFLRRRDRKYEELKNACRGHKVPQMRIAAEAHLAFDFTDFERIDELCIEGTNYMLVEMPPGPWKDWMIEALYKLSLRGIRPIMAHIDRYLRRPEKWFRLMDELQPVYQVNSYIFRTYKGRRAALGLFKKGRIHVLGSDMHGLTGRNNTIPEGYENLKKHFGKEYVGLIEENGKRILENKEAYKSGMLPHPKNPLLFI